MREGGSARRSRRRKLLLLGLAWIAVLALAPFVAPTPIAPGELLAPDSPARLIFWQIRLPRILLALAAGGALAAAGLAFQTRHGNPLAEPYTLGVASGAALGAVLAQQLDAVAPRLAGLGVYAASFAGALAVTAAILVLSRRRVGLETESLLLAGIAISLTCSALILFVQYLADFTKTFRMVRWLMGGLAVVGYGEVLWLVPWVLVGSSYLMMRRFELDQLLTGEELAASRGVDVARLRWEILAVTSGMIGALVAVTGPIGFLGLVVPHVLRRWLGHDHLILLPAAVAGGGVFLALSDLAARQVLAPAELPVGVLTALVGGPFFLWLLLSRRRGESG